VWGGGGIRQEKLVNDPADNSEEVFAASYELYPEFRE
jgi:hypothetical protein